MAKAESELLDPKNDYVFKRLFNEHPTLLVSLINDLRPEEPAIKARARSLLPYAIGLQKSSCCGDTGRNPTMSAALELYAQLTEAPDEKTRARLIADAFDALEARFPQINELATQGHVRESELRLQKEIKEVEARLQEQMREIDARLQEQIKGLELQIRKVEARMTEMEGRLRTELKQVEVNLHQAMAAQTRWLLVGLAVLGAVFKLADLLIGP